MVQDLIDKIENIAYAYKIKLTDVQLLRFDNGVMQIVVDFLVFGKDYIEFRDLVLKILKSVGLNVDTFVVRCECEKQCNTPVILEFLIWL